MTQRNETLQHFVDAASAAFDRCAKDPASRHSISRIFAALASPGPQATEPGKRLPVCRHLVQALEIGSSDETLGELVGAFRTIEPSLQWRRRSSDASASDNFVDGHANAMVFGPGGLEDRRDVWLGASLLAPNVRYPDHDHAPEETYLVLSEGDFQHGDSSWFTPGIGGSLYNTPGIKHAMRSGERPLFAFWALWTGNASVVR